MVAIVLVLEEVVVVQVVEVVVGVQVVEIIVVADFFQSSKLHCSFWLTLIWLIPIIIPIPVPVWFIWTPT